MRLPDQLFGNECSCSLDIEYNSLSEIEDHFLIARKRLLDVNKWSSIIKLKSGVFQLTDELGNDVYTEARKGLFIRIRIKGPVNHVGSGYDWVKVEEVCDNKSNVGLRLRPCPSPKNSISFPAHFFDSNATNTLQLFRLPNLISAQFNGNNERVNSAVKPFGFKMRNYMVGKMSIWGFSNAHWKDLLVAVLSE